MEKVWSVYIVSNDFENTLTILGITYDLEAFKKLAKETYSVNSEPIKDYYSKGSLHYDFSNLNTGILEYYTLIAEPTKIITISN